MRMIECSVEAFFAAGAKKRKVNRFRVNKNLYGRPGPEKEVQILFIRSS